MSYNYVPLHKAEDTEKIKSMVEEIKAGRPLPRIFVHEDGRALSGSHRLAAIKQIDKELADLPTDEWSPLHMILSDRITGGLVMNVVEVSDVNYCKAIEKVGNDYEMHAIEEVLNEMYPVKELGFEMIR